MAVDCAPFRLEASTIISAVGQQPDFGPFLTDPAVQAKIADYKTVGYYAGQGPWAPIMGVGYYKPVTQWSRGEYANANNTEDDLARIVSNNNDVDYRADDTGATLATSRYLEIYPNSSAFAEGVVETTGDTDAFQFTTSGGAVSLRADPART